MKLPKYNDDFLGELLRQFNKEVTMQVNADANKICGNDTSPGTESWNFHCLNRGYRFWEVEKISDCIPTRKIEKVEKFLDQLVKDVALLLADVTEKSIGMRVKEDKKKKRKAAKKEAQEANLPAYFLQRATYKLGMGDQVIVRVQDRFECVTVVDLPSVADTRIEVVMRGVNAVPFRVDHCDFVGALIKA